jgi:hypothetical protein
MQMGASILKKNNCGRELPELANFDELCGSQKM